MTAWRPPGPALLFCPGDRPERFVKALERADAVVLDLEDGVVPEAKEAAREAVVAALPGLDPQRTIVRVNAADSPYLERDLAALKTVGSPTLMLPKAADPATLELLAPLPTIAICETAAGVLGAPAVAAARNCVGLLYGTEDLAVSLGGRTSRLRPGEMSQVGLHARTVSLLAAKAAGRVAIDRVHLDSEGDGLAAEASEAAALGFDAKACIHPAQVAPIRAAFAPLPGEIEWARAVLAAAAHHAGAGAFLVAGQMVDAPLLEQAKLTIAAAEAAERRGE